MKIEVIPTAMMWRHTIRDRIDLNRNTLLALAQEIANTACNLDLHRCSQGVMRHGKVGIEVNGKPGLGQPLFHEAHEVPIVLNDQQSQCEQDRYGGAKLARVYHHK